MSGNGTRIAAAWLMGRTGSTQARVHVGPANRRRVRRSADGLYESDMGAVEVGATRDRRRRRAHAGLGRQPARGRRRRPGADRRARPAARDASALPESDERPGRPRRRPGEVTARVWERGVGETTASGSSAVAVAAATHGDGDVLVHFPGGDLRVRLREAGPAHRAGRAARRSAGAGREATRPVAGSPISSPPRAEGELPALWVGAWPTHDRRDG